VRQLGDKFHIITRRRFHESVRSAIERVREGLVATDGWSFSLASNEFSAKN
jgi:hypothetical protein